MEKRIHTGSFAMRFATSMFGCLFTDVFFAHRYFNDADAEFKVEMLKLSYSLMHNRFLQESSPNSNKSSKASSRSSPSGCIDCEHELIPLKYVKGFIGYKQQRCILCNGKTSWCCQDCTAGPQALVPICPKVTVGRGSNTGVPIKHGCLARHRANPALIPGRRHAAKRVRGCGSPGSESFEGAEECHDVSHESADE